jgi:ADP-ribose pyrophosphatase
MSEPDTKPTAVDIIEKRVAYQGYFRIDRYRLRHELFGGGMSKPLEREVFERGHAVGLLPYDPQRDVVVLIEQFRVGAYAAGFDPWMLEIVAGIVEDGETPEDVARRESREEADLALTDLIPMCHYIASPGGASETCRLFLGRVDSSGVGGIHGLDHEDEDIRVESMPFAEARRLLDAGRLTNALSIIALQWLALHRDEVRAKWR